MNSSQYWLLKTEGESYPIEKLQKDKKTPWSGVRNFQARNFMKNDMRLGDLCLFYHSSSSQNGVYGIARVASKPYPDPTQFDPPAPRLRRAGKKSHYFESRSTKEKPYWWLVDIAFVRKFKHPILAIEMKNDSELSGMMLWHTPRLSIQPVSERHFKHITEKLAS